MQNSIHATKEELFLIAEAKKALRNRRRPHKNTVSAGVLTADGQTYLGLNLESRKSGICAEPAAIALAHFHRSYDIVAIGAVCFTPDLTEIEVISPCGACRELIWYHAPHARVLMPAALGIIAMAATELFAMGETFPFQSRDV